MIPRLRALAARGGPFVAAALVTIACTAPAASSKPPPPPAAAPPAGAAPAAVAPATSAATSAAAPPPASASPSAEQPLLKARSGYTTTAAPIAPWWTALDAGYFREQGLDVELVRIDAGAATLAAMANGELDVTYAGGSVVVLGYLQGLETMIIGSQANTLDVEVFARPDIQRAEELRGKTIGVTRLKSISDIAARLGLRHVGLQPDVDVFTRGTGGNLESLAALETGTLDGAALSVPAVFEAQKRGYRSVLNVAELGVWYLGAGIAATKRVLNERPDLGDRYLRALAQATNRLQTDREYAIEIIGRYNQMNDRELLGATVDYYRPLFLLDPYPDPKAVQAVLDSEEDPRARALRPEDVTDYRFAERLRASGFLDRLPK